MPSVKSEWVTKQRYQVVADMYQMSESKPMTKTSVCEESDSQPWCYTSPSPEVVMSGKLFTSPPPPPTKRSSVNFMDSPSDDSITTEILSIPTLLRLQPQPIPPSQITNATYDDHSFLSLNPNEGEKTTTTTPQIPRVHLRMRRSNRIPNHVTIDQHHSAAAQANMTQSGEEEGQGTVKTEEKLERFR